MLTKEACSNIGWIQAVYWKAKQLLSKIWDSSLVAQNYLNKPKNYPYSSELENGQCDNESTYRLNRLSFRVSKSQNMNNYVHAWKMDFISRELNLEKFAIQIFLN